VAPAAAFAISVRVTMERLERVAIAANRLSFCLHPRLDRPRWPGIETAFALVI
jgi:hypothetical protein